jgi:glycerate kinase
LACDVSNPLLGPTGAAAIYGPQKGATELDVAILAEALTHWADIVERTTRRRYREQPGTGGAGGVGFAALALLNATIRPGTELLLELLGFPDRLRHADLVITGEGSLDDQTLYGKGLAGVATIAIRQNVPAFAIAGRVTLDCAALTRAGLARAYALTDLEADPRRCITNARHLLALTAQRLAADWAVAENGRARSDIS